MQNETMPNRPIWYHSPYVMPAILLSPEPTHESDPSSLRAEASVRGLCYLKLTRSFHDGTYLGRVAASPEALRSGGYTLVVTDTQLTKAYPWHRHLQSA